MRAWILLVLIGCGGGVVNGVDASAEASAQDAVALPDANASDSGVEAASDAAIDVLDSGADAHVSNCPVEHAMCPTADEIVCLSGTGMGPIAEAFQCQSGTWEKTMRDQSMCPKWCMP